MISMDRVKWYAKACCATRPATLHFAVREDSKSLCGKRLKDVYCEYLDPLPRCIERVEQLPI